MERTLADYNRICGEKTKLEHRFDDLNTNYNSVTRKYQESLATNLSLSRKLTQSNEDYLEIAKAKETTEDKLKRARNNAKKTLKIKV